MKYIKEYYTKDTRDYLADLEDYLQEIFDKYHIEYSGDFITNKPYYKMSNRFELLMLSIHNIEDFSSQILADLKRIKHNIENRLGCEIFFDYISSTDRSSYSKPNWIYIYFSIPEDHYRRGQA